MTIYLLRAFGAPAEPNGWSYFPGHWASREEARFAKRYCHQVEGYPKGSVQIWTFKLDREVR